MKQPSLAQIRFDCEFFFRRVSLAPRIVPNTFALTRLYLGRILEPTRSLTSE